MRGFLPKQLQIGLVSVENYMNALDLLYENTGLIGGEGHTVEIDETKVGKRKYNRGRMRNSNSRNSKKDTFNTLINDIARLYNPNV